MIIALYCLCITNGAALLSMELPPKKTRPTDSQLATAAWYYSNVLDEKRGQKLSDKDVDTAIITACNMAKITLYDGIADDLAQQCASWPDIVSAVHTLDPKQIFIPFKKPYSVAHETGTVVIDAESTPKQTQEMISQYLTPSLVLKDPYNNKKKYDLAGDYWIWDKANRPQISPNGRYFLGLRYSEKEYSLADLVSLKETAIPRNALLGLCLTNSHLYAVTATKFYKSDLPITQSSPFKENPFYTYTKPVLKSDAEPIIHASSDGAVCIVQGENKTAWIHRKIDTTFFTEEITLPNSAGSYSFIPVSPDCIIGINRNSWYDAGKKHVIGHRPDGLPYGHDTLILKEFAHSSAGCGAVSPDGKLLAIESLQGDLAIFELKKDTVPTLFLTLKNIGSLISWNNTIGQPIVCYGSKKDGTRGSGIILIYPSAGCYALDRYKSITLRTPPNQ